MKEISSEIKEYTAGSFLSRLWRKVVLNDGYHKILHLLMNDYIQRLTIKSLSNTKISINRTNIHQKIVDSSMTWKNLMFLLENIIRIKELETILHIELDDGKRVYKETGIQGDILSKIWKNISDDIDNLGELVDNYHIREVNNPNKINKTNLNKKMSSTHDMTWNTLMFLIDEILLAREFTITIKLKSARGLYTKHTISYKIKE